jgi:hypothetical protein
VLLRSRHAFLARCQHTAALSAPVAAPLPAPPPPPAPPAAAAAAGDAPPARSDWTYIAYLLLGVSAAAAPLLLVTQVQDDARLRAWVRARAPRALAALGSVLEVPSDVPASAAGVELPTAVVLEFDDGARGSGGGGGGGGAAALPAVTPLRDALPSAVDAGDPLTDVARAQAAGLRTLPRGNGGGGGGAEAAEALVAADPSRVCRALARPAQARAAADAAAAAAADAALARARLFAQPHAVPLASLVEADAAMLAAAARADAARFSATTAATFDDDDDDDDDELRRLDAQRRRRRWWWSAPPLVATAAPPFLHLSASAERLARTRCRRAAVLAQAKALEAALPAIAEERREAAAAAAARTASADAPPLVPRDSAGNRVRLRA